MSEFPDLVTGETVDDDTLYRLSAIKAVATEIVPLENRAILAVRDIETSTEMFSFGVYETHTDDGHDVQMSLLMHGRGAAGYLRELRHLWIGDGDGYVFYPNGAVITSAMVALRRWFDLD